MCELILFCATSQCVAVNLHLVVFHGALSECRCYVCHRVLLCRVSSFISSPQLTLCLAVVCDLMAGSCKMISKQTAKSPSSSSLSQPLSPVISIFHLLVLSILSTLLQLRLPNFHLTHFLSSQSSHTFPPFPLSVHPDICVARVCIRAQLVVQFGGFWRMRSCSHAGVLCLFR